MKFISKCCFFNIKQRFLLKSTAQKTKSFKPQNLPSDGIFFKPIHKFSTFPQSQTIFSKDSQPQMFKLQQQYKQEQNLSIFQSFITNSTGTNHQMTIFKIFKVMQISPFNKRSYDNLFELLNKMIKKKSDNVLLLLASIKRKIGQNYKKQQKYPLAIGCLEEALDILQYSMVPPLFPYYSIYRQYGLLHDIIGQYEKAKQILTQTVEILDDFVSNSDDAVSTNDYCKKMASSYNCLARIDPSSKDKWVQKAEDAWKGFSENKYNELEYAKTVSLIVQKLLKQDKQKGQAYFHFNLYKFQNKEIKELLKKAKQQASF